MEPLKRVRFFHGQLLTPEDLAAEQDYQLRRRRILNLRVFGAGVVTGLHVSADAAGIRVTPGLAIDRLGREILLPEPAMIAHSPALPHALLVLSHQETLTDPIPSPTWGEVEYTRIEEGFHLALVPSGLADADTVVLAELKQTVGGWRLIPPRTSSLGWAAAAILGILTLFSWRICRRSPC